MNYNPMYVETISFISESTSFIIYFIVTLAIAFTMVCFAFVLRAIHQTTSGQSHLHNFTTFARLVALVGVTWINRIIATAVYH